MSSVSNNINSYDAGGKPFRHDSNRGKWKSQTDFYLVCIGHAFNSKCFTILPFFIQSKGGVFFIIPYTIAFLLFTLPVFIFQSFLGQFSSTGFISVFRISPLFKGIGYVILILNASSICYYSALVSYSLIYFFVSFDPDLPWMSCNNTFNTENCTVPTPVSADDKNSSAWDDIPFYIYSKHWSTLEYFVLGIINYDPEIEDTTTKIAWPIFIGTIIVWSFIAAIFYKGFEMINLAIRFCAIVSLALFTLFFVRVICLPGGFHGIAEFLSPELAMFNMVETFIPTPIITIFIFGSGWGTVLTMASYNNFKTDIIQYSTLIGFILMILFGLCSLMTFIIEEYLYEYFKFSYFNNTDYLLEYLMVALPFLIGTLEAPNMWGMIFFGMLFLCEFCGLIIQMLAILTALFDEYEQLRAEKQRVTLAIITCLGLFSLFFTTNKDIFFVNVLASFGSFTQMLICFLELIVVVWLYGRERFQRDIQFMLGRTFATWKFFVIRFVTPIFILGSSLIFLLFSVGGIIYLGPSIFDTVLILSIKVLPWLCIPAYIGIKLSNTTGTLYHRFKKSIWPTDWYPVDPIYRQRYEETLGTSDISHQLVMMKNEDDVEEC